MRYCWRPNDQASVAHEGGPGAAGRAGSQEGASGLRLMICPTATFWLHFWAACGQKTGDQTPAHLASHASGRLKSEDGFGHVSFFPEGLPCPRRAADSGRVAKVEVIQLPRQTDCRTHPRGQLFLRA